MYKRNEKRNIHTNFSSESIVLTLFTYSFSMGDNKIKINETAINIEKFFLLLIDEEEKKMNKKKKNIV